MVSKKPFLLILLAVEAPKVARGALLPSKRLCPPPPPSQKEKIAKISQFSSIFWFFAPPPPHFALSMPAQNEIIVSRLSKRIVVSGKVFDWLWLYRESWTIRVDITANFGIPHGPVVGPVRNTIITLPVGDIARHHGINYHLYADFMYSSNHQILPNWKMHLLLLQNCLKTSKSEWMSTN